MGKLYVFMGKSAAGKDTLYHQVMERFPALLPVTPYTTRPVRTGEEEGKEYHFVTEERFRELEREGKIVEYRCYETVKGPWYYFTADDGQLDFDKGDYILISTLEGYEKLQAAFGIGSIVPVYIEVDDLERLERAVRRERSQVSPCVPELCRRFLADEEDFSEERLQMAGIEMRIVNEDLETAVENVEKLIRGNTHITLD